MPKAQDDDLVMSLVELALSQPPDTREAYLRTACGDDAELFREVWDYVQWNHRMQDFLLEPLYSALPEHQFEPGELLADRFRIVREVAQGGMGIVYEAEDERLGRRIALKCAKSGFRKRLPPEVRHASEISHPQCLQDFRDPHGVDRRAERSIFSPWSFWRVRRWPRASAVLAEGPVAGSRSPRHRAADLRGIGRSASQPEWCMAISRATT